MLSSNGAFNVPTNDFAQEPDQHDNHEPTAGHSEVHCLRRVIVRFVRKAAPRRAGCVGENQGPFLLFRRSLLFRAHARRSRTSLQYPVQLLRS